MYLFYKHTLTHTAISRADVVVRHDMLRKSIEHRHAYEEGTLHRMRLAGNASSHHDRGTVAWYGLSPCVGGMFAWRGQSGWWCAAQTDSWKAPANVMWLKSEFMLTEVTHCLLPPSEMHPRLFTSTWRFLELGEIITPLPHPKSPYLLLRFHQSSFCSVSNNNVLPCDDSHPAARNCPAPQSYPSSGRLEKEAGAFLQQVFYSLPVSVSLCQSCVSVIGLHKTKAVTIVLL